MSFNKRFLNIIIAFTYYLYSNIERHSFLLNGINQPVFSFIDQIYNAMNILLVQGCLLSYLSIAMSLFAEVLNAL